MKAKLNYFSLLLFSNVRRLAINDMLGVEAMHRFSGWLMLVLTLFIITGNAKAAKLKFNSESYAGNLNNKQCITLQKVSGAESARFLCVKGTAAGVWTGNAIVNKAIFINS
jgi:hypothetical protein